jgi:hypothetical protein
MSQSVVRRKPVSYIEWEDVFVLIDTGQGRAADYDPVCRAIVSQSERHGGGIGCLTIIPDKATPPSEEARRAINDAIGRIERKLRCLCWLVEGSGFQAAMCRAVLVGLRVFGSRTYPTHISTDIDEAVGWILPYLSRSRPAERAQAVAAIRRGRMDEAPSLHMLGRAAGENPPASHTR